MSPVVSADGRWLLIQEECTAVLYDLWHLRAAGLLAGWLDDPDAGRLLVAGDRPSREALRARLLHAARIEEQARQLIEKLGDDDFEKRVATQRTLRELGPLAAPALIAAARDSDDLEIRTRCKPLVEAIAPAARARWGEPLLLEAMLRCLREGPIPGSPALCDEIARTFPDSLIRRLARSIQEAKP